MNEAPSLPAREDDQTDLFFDILSNSRRRHVLAVLCENGGSVTDLRELADRVAARENDKPLDQLTDREQKCVYVSLYQAHAPRLRESGFVTFDAETGEIHLTDRSSLFSPFLGGGHPSRHGHYVLLAVGSALFYVGVLLGVTPLDSIPPFVAGLFVFLLFGALAFAEHY